MISNVIKMLLHIVVHKRESQQTWMQNARPNMLLASQCFCETYHAQKKVPGIDATI